MRRWRSAQPPSGGANSNGAASSFPAPARTPSCCHSSSACRRRRASCADFACDLSAVDQEARQLPECAVADTQQLWLDKLRLGSAAPLALDRPPAATPAACR